MVTEFVTARFPDAEVPKVQSRGEMADRVHRFIPPGSKARLREVGREFGPWRNERDLVDRVLARVDRLGVGPKLIVQRERDFEQLSIREVDRAPAIPDLGAHPTIERLHADAWDQFPVRSGGLWLCRYIDGTNDVSRHGYLKEGAGGWKGAAEDVFVTSGGMPRLRQVAMMAVNGGKAGLYKGLLNVIVDTSIFSAPTFNERAYGGRPHYHVHWDCSGGGPCDP